MKLILAIVSNDDSGAVSSSMTKGGFQITKLATTGGFLMAGNTTFISGVDDDKVGRVLVFGYFVALLFEHTAHLEAVVLVHLATVGLNVGFFGHGAFSWG